MLINSPADLTSEKDFLPSVVAGDCSQMVESGMIDWDRVNELRTEIGDDGFDEVVELFLDEVESVVMRLGSDPDPSRYEDDLHFLKGSAWNLGFAEFGAICQDGERKAATGESDQINISAVIYSYGRSKEEFMKRLHADEAGNTNAA